MIFPGQCKQVGWAQGLPLGEKVYFLSRYLIRPVDDGYEIIGVTLSGTGGIMRDVVGTTVLAGPGEVEMYPGRVNLHDRTRLVRLAAAGGKRCTIFTGHDEHTTFVLDPDMEELTTLHIYDVTPPRPHLADTLKELEAAGLFGELGIRFEWHIQDIAATGADAYPCRAAGFSCTVDNDRLTGTELVAGCLTARQVLAECYEDGAFEFVNICPADNAEAEPFIARCCRSERSGTGNYNGHYGAIVHWGATPKTIADAVFAVAEGWRMRP